MTPNKEDYLKCIYELGQLDHKISNKEIAANMEVSAPAVSEMSKKLIAEGWLLKDKSQGYLLTHEGQLAVSAIYRKHRLIEIFLIEQLHYDPAAIHAEAEVLEHTVSDLFIERLDSLLGKPKFCPHGGTIPEAGKLLEEIHKVRLSQTSQLGTYQLVRFRDNSDLLNYMQQYNIELGSHFEFLGHDDFAQTYQLQLGNNIIHVTAPIASQLYVKPYRH